MMTRQRRRHRRSGTRSDADPGFQIAPMIDVVFVVLVFFMALAAQIRVERDLALRLPGTPASGVAALPEEEYTVAVGPLGEISFNDEPCDGPESTDLPGLRTLLGALRSGRPADRPAAETSAVGLAGSAGVTAMADHGTEDGGTRLATGVVATGGANAVVRMTPVTDEGPMIVIASDPSSRYDRTIAVLDALAAAGMRRVSLAGEEDLP